MAQRKAKETTGDTDSANGDDVALKRQITVDYDVLSSLALHAPADIVESHYRQTRKAMKRLGLSDGHPLDQVELVGTYPNVLDMIRWLDSIDNKSKAFRKDRIFLASFHKTLENRLPPSVVEKIEKEEAA